MTIEFTASMHEAWERHDLTEFQRLLDQNYVTRWGYIRIPVPRELSRAEVWKYLQDDVKHRAKYMGATVVNIDDPTISSTPDFRTDTIVYTWKVRRD